MATTWSFEQALKQQQGPLIQRVSMVARWDFVVFNPESKTLEVWRNHEGKRLVVCQRHLPWISEERQFKDIVWLMGAVAQLPCISSAGEHRIPEPWWGYRFE